MISDPLAVKPSNEQSPVDHFLLGDHERYQTWPNWCGSSQTVRWMLIWPMRAIPLPVVLSRIQRVRDDGHRADAHRHAVEEYLSRNSVDEVGCQRQKMGLSENVQDTLKIASVTGKLINYSYLLLTRFVFACYFQTNPNALKLDGCAKGQKIWGTTDSGDNCSNRPCRF